MSAAARLSRSRPLIVLTLVLLVRTRTAAEQLRFEVPIMIKTRLLSCQNVMFPSEQIGFMISLSLSLSLSLYLSLSLSLSRARAQRSDDTELREA